MARCSNCGREGSRVRTTCHEKRPGVFSHFTDECPNCAPGSFEPRWHQDKIVPAWEAYPNRYRKVWGEDGTLTYVATEENRTDSEARLKLPHPDDVASKERAIERRRQWARTQPKKLTATQIEAAKARWLPRLRAVEAEKRARREAVEIQNSGII